MRSKIFHNPMPMLMLGLLCGCLGAADLPAQSATRVLVLDFGLDDDTLLPRVPKEVARAAALAPYLRFRLTEGGLDVVPYASDAETLALSANGYFVAHPGAAAAIGRAAGAEWVALGVQRKFSFLISWLRVYLIEVKSGRVVGRAEADLRGAMTDTRMTRRAAVSLGDQLLEFMTTLRHRREEQSR